MTETGRACAAPPGDILPLPREAFMQLQNEALRERERCVGCGDDGEYWYGHGWLCKDCAQ